VCGKTIPELFFSAQNRGGCRTVSIYRNIFLFVLATRVKGDLALEAPWVGVKVKTAKEGLPGSQHCSREL